MTPDEEISAVLELYGERAKLTTPSGFAEPSLTIRPISTNPNIRLEIQLHGTYPSDLPTLSFEGLSNADASALYGRLEEVGKARSKQPMLLEILSATTEWLRNKSPGNNEGTDQTVSVAIQSEEPVEPQVETDVAVPLGSASSKERMRTAKDVVGRIRWDEQLNGADFSVSYLDRFSGEMEEPFQSVDWDNAPFPHHRIQSFKFKGVTVWDKRISLDNVFGSRGTRKKIEDVLQETSEAEGRTSRRHYCLSIPVKDSRLTESIRELQTVLSEQILSDEDSQGNDECALNLVMCRITTERGVAVEIIKQVLSKLKLLFSALVPHNAEIRLEVSKVLGRGILCVNPNYSEGMNQLMTKIQEALNAVNIELVPIHILCEASFNPLAIDMQAQQCTNCAEKHLGEVSVKRLELLDAHSDVLLAVSNNLASLHESVPSLLVNNTLERLVKKGCVFAEDAAHLSAKLKTDPSSVTDSELDQLVHPTLRHRIQDMDGAAGTVILLSGPLQWRMSLTQSLCERLNDIAVISFSSTDSESVLEHCGALYRNMDTFMEAMEEEVPWIVFDDVSPQRHEHRLFWRIASVAGYRLRLIDFRADGGPDALSFSTVRNGRSWSSPTVTSVTASGPSLEELVEEIIGGQSVEEEAAKTASGEWKALCIFLTARSKVDLIRRVPPAHQHIYADCIVLTRSPTSLQLQESLPLGSTVQLIADGIRMNAQLESCRVQITGNRKRLPHCARTLDLVISSQAPLDQTDLWQPAELASGYRAMEPIQLRGVLGVRSTHPARQHSDWKIIWPRLLQEEFYLPEPPLSKAQVEIATDESEITELNIVDFDGTLMCELDEFVGRKEYEELTGEPYPHQGWYGRAESLSPPVRVLPGPAMRDCRSLYGHEGSWTVVLTARIFKLRPVLESVLKRYSVEYDELMCKKSARDTQDFKVSTVMNLLQKFPHVHKIRIWDDNVENLVAFYKLQESLRGTVDVEVIEAPTMPPPLGMGDRSFDWESRDGLYGLMSFLDAMGRLRDKTWMLHCETGLETIVSAWKQTLELTVPSQSLFFLTGPYAFGRVRCTVELHLIGPQQENAVAKFIEILHQLQLKPQQNGRTVNIRIPFMGNCPINFLVSFVQVEIEALDELSTVRKQVLEAMNGPDAENAVQDLKAQERIERLFEREAKGLAMFHVALETLEQIVGVSELKWRQSCHVGTVQLAHLIATFYEQQWEDSDYTSDQFCLSLIECTAELNAEALLQYFRNPDGDLASHGPTIKDAEHFVRMMQRSRRIFQSSGRLLHWTQVFDLLVSDR